MFGDWLKLWEENKERDVNAGTWFVAGAVFWELLKNNEAEKQREKKEREFDRWLKTGKTYGEEFD